MSLDHRIKDAIVEAVNGLEQEPALASRLIAWFEALADGNESLDDKDAAFRHMDLLYQAVTVESQDV